MDARKIKDGIECCIENTCEVCEVCPYFKPSEHSDACTGNLLADALELIEQLEERIAIMTEIKEGR